MTARCVFEETGGRGLTATGRGSRSSQWAQLRFSLRWVPAESQWQMGPPKTCQQWRSIRGRLWLCPVARWDPTLTKRQDSSATSRQRPATLNRTVNQQRLRAPILRELTSNQAAKVRFKTLRLQRPAHHRPRVPQQDPDRQQPLHRGARGTRSSTRDHRPGGLRRPRAQQRHLVVARQHQAAPRNPPVQASPRRHHHLRKGRQPRPQRHRQRPNPQRLSPRQRPPNQRRRRRQRRQRRSPRQQPVGRRSRRPCAVSREPRNSLPIVVSLT